MLSLRFQNDSCMEIGVDEAGRGPLWGPLMAAAVIWPPESSWTDAHRELVPMIQDSKKIAPKKREKICAKIQELALAIGVGSVAPAEIDNLGATRANQLAFRRALDDCYIRNAGTLVQSKRVLIDGTLPLNDRRLNEMCHTIIDGDAKYLSIAAASIVAKVTHDAWVIEWCSNNIADAAKYDLLSCKGYGTAKHRAGILRHGYTDLHRRLYLRKLIPDIVVTRCQFINDDGDDETQSDTAGF
jgi:ribonuclease HII